MPSKKKAEARIDPDVPLLLDTHIAVWLSQGSSKIKPLALSAIEAGFHRRKLFLSPISAWEIGMLVSKGRLALGQHPREWIAEFNQQFRVSILELTPDIAINSRYLPGTFHGDPADRMLVATALANQAALVSADQNIMLYAEQGFLQVVPVR